MKKMFFALVITVVSSAAAFANTTNPVNEKVLKTFSSEFTTASNVSWTELKTKGLFHAIFNYNDQKLDAFFDEEGELVATTRTIDKKQLPMAITKELGDRYTNAFVNTDVLEYISEGSTSYFVTVITAKASLVLKASSDGSMYVYKKIKK
jgi:hypothetical protein